MAWGRDLSDYHVPEPNTQFVAVAAGQWHSLGLTAIPKLATPFYATLVHDDGAVLLRWSLPSCFGGAGLMIYRAHSADGSHSCVTPEPLPDVALGRYVDETAWPGGTFWYELRALLPSGEEVLATDIHPSVVVPGTLVFGIRYVMPNPATARASIGYALPEECGLPGSPCMMWLAGSSGGWIPRRTLRVSSWSIGTGRPALANEWLLACTSCGSTSMEPSRRSG